MNTENIIETIKRYKIHPNKKLGQNFLCNDGLLKKIVDVSNINKNDNILEIGPGLGDLTALLSEKAGSVTSVEIDSGIYNFLKNKFKDTSNLKLVHGDFLKTELAGIFTKSVSNLPYYASSEILFRLAQKYKINELYVMLQKEMAARIFSGPGTKTYGALTVSLGLYYDSKVLFNIDKSSFYPKPEVSSSFFYLKRKHGTGLDPEETTIFHNLVKAAFWGRRKTLKSTMINSPHMNLNANSILDIFDGLKLDKTIRGENLSIEDFKTIAKYIYQIKKSNT